MTRCIVTGAGGFVGRAITDALGAAGLDVVAIDRGFHGAPQASIRRVESDLESLDANGVGKADILIHGAAITASPEAASLTPAAHIARNVGLTLSALRLAESAGVARFINLSSAAVFAADHAGPLDETAGCSGIAPYAIAKRMGELATASLANPDFATISVRFGNLYGPGETSSATRPVVSVAQRIIDAVERGNAPPRSAQDALRDWTFVPDAAARIAELAQREDWPAAILHLVSPNHVRDSDLIAAARNVSPNRNGSDAEGMKGAVRPPLLSLHQSWWRTPDWTSLQDGVRAIAASAR